MKLALLGTGRMGFPMARRLCQAGHAVHVWNRSADKAAPLAADGATVHASAAEAAAAADIVIGMLENGPVVASVLFDQGAAAAMRPGVPGPEPVSYEEPTDPRGPLEPKDVTARAAAGVDPAADRPAS